MEVSGLPKWVQILRVVAWIGITLAFVKSFIYLSIY